MTPRCTAKLGANLLPRLGFRRPCGEAETRPGGAFARPRQGDEGAGDGAEAGLGPEPHGAGGAILGPGVGGAQQRLPGLEVVTAGIGRLRLLEAGMIAPDPAALGIVEVAGG